MKTKIVWNGCDNYIEADEAEAMGYDFDGEKLYHGGQEFAAFEVEEINLETLQKNDDGDADISGVFGTETGKFYK